MVATKSFLRELVPRDDANIDIVAVHGLNATDADFHAYETWTADGPDGKLWLRDFLPEALPNARILIFGYNANVKAQASTSGIQGQVENLLDWLDNEPQRRAHPDRPILFIAHSLGGIVVKKALLQAKLTKRFLPIREATYGIAFFATPHRGGQYGLLGELVAKVVQGEFGNSNNTLIESLKHDGIYSNELVENFREELEDLHVLSFYEDREFKDLGLIVDKESATLGLSTNREKRVPLDADHRSICKFGSATDDDYIQVSRGIVRLVNEATDDFSKRQRQATGSDLLQPQGTSVPPTALHDACSEGDLGKISSLLEASADINARDSREFTPLMIACERDDLGVVGFLLSKGADPKRDSSLFKSPISLAIDNGNTEMVTLLFDNGVPIDQRTRMRMSLVEVQITPLGQAAGKGHASLVELILQRNPGPDVNAKLGVLGWTSLHHAVNGGHEAVVRLLLQYNARIDITDVKGHTPLDPMGTRARMRKKGQDLTRVSNLIENWRSEGMYSESAALLVQRPNTFWKAADEAMIQHTLADAGFVPIVRAGVNPNPQSTRSQPTSVSSNTSNWQPGPGPSRSPPSSQPAFGLPSLPPRPSAAYPQTPGERPPYAVERPINRPGATDPVPPAATTNIPTRRREVNEPGRFGRFVARLTR